MSIRDQYVFITNKDENMQCIGIRKGKFEGVVYKYGKVSLGEETKDGNLLFRFEYDILDNNMILERSLMMKTFSNFLVIY